MTDNEEAKSYSIIDMGISSLDGHRISTPYGFANTHFEEAT